MAEDKSDSARPIPLRYLGSEAQQRTVFANNLIVQHTDAEFFLSFYEVAPPLVGLPEEAAEVH